MTTKNKTNVDEAMDALETALRILDSESLRNDANKNLSGSSLVYVSGVVASITVALEKLKD
jgi:hypothetical protein